MARSYGSDAADSPRLRPRHDSMYTAAEIQMIRNIDPGAVLPGIDTKTGNPVAASSLIDVAKLTKFQRAILLRALQERRLCHAGGRRAERDQFRHGDGAGRRQQCDDQGLHIQRNDRLLRCRANRRLQRPYGGEQHLHRHQITDREQCLDRLRPGRHDDQGQ